MIQKTLKLRIPEGFELENIEKAISENKVLMNKIKHKVLPANVLCQYNMNGSKKLVPINLDDDIKIISYNMCEEHILNNIIETEDEKYIEFTFQIKGKSEKLYYGDAEAILRGKYDLSQEKLEIDGIDILVSSDKINFKKYNVKYGDAICLDILLPNYINSEEMYQYIKNNKRIKDLMDKFSFFGELEKTKSSLDKFFQIDLLNVSHNILGIYKDSETSTLKANVVVYKDNYDLERAVLVPRMTTHNGHKIGSVITFDLVIM